MGRVVEIHVWRCLLLCVLVELPWENARKGLTIPSRIKGANEWEGSTGNPLLSNNGSRKEGQEAGIDKPSFMGVERRQQLIPVLPSVAPEGLSKN